MTSRDRFLTALRRGIPDRVPVTPDISNYIPCRRTGLPFWEIYFNRQVELWRAYLDTADYFGIDAWNCSSGGVGFTPETEQFEATTEQFFDADRDLMVRRTRFQTPDGELTQEVVCPRADPPSMVEKPIKDLVRDLRSFHWLNPMPAAIDVAAAEEMRAECTRRGHAFGLGCGYPGFQGWSGCVQGGVAPLAYAEIDQPELLEAWHEHDLAIGTRRFELLLSVKPDYILFGGSGTITLASPTLARKYALPALKRWSQMARDAGVLTLLHSCGKARALVDMLAEETCVDMVNPLEIAPMGDVDLAEVKRARGHQIGLMGNLHTTHLMLHGTPEQVRAAALQAMRDGGVGGGFILSTGDQCPRDVPDVNLFTLVETARQYGRYAPDGSLPDLP